MTTNNDSLETRLASDAYGPGPEETVGVPIDGFADPTGEYPNRDYFFGPSVNNAARGINVNKLTLRGGDLSVSLQLVDQKSSAFPFNDVRETPSGHVIEVDDTPGGERILIKHRLGSGIELKADGSVAISSTRNKVTVASGDDTVIVEGEGHLIYKGNMTLNVTGDYNVNVGGNYNLSVGGNEKYDIRGSSRGTIGTNSQRVVNGDNDDRVIGSHGLTILGDEVHSVKGDHTILTEGDIEIASGSSVFMTAKNDCLISAVSASLTAANLSVQGVNGTIGGTNIDHFGSTYSGPRDNTTMYGTLVGKATEAYTADFAQKADEAHSAYHANAAAVAGFAKEDGGSAYGAFLGPKTLSTIVLDPDYKLFHSFTVVEPVSHMPGSNLISAMLSTTDHAIRDVRVDLNDDILNKAIKTDDYDGQVNYTPNIDEVRHILRDPAALNNNELTRTLIAESRLNSRWQSQSPDATLGRVASGAPSLRFGYTTLGNNPMENISKRFKPTS